jgi:hypothetical protein
MSGDLAVIFPLAELARDRTKYLPEIVYYYDVNTGLNDFKLDVKFQINSE